jgi:hypothetical protein
MKNYYFVLFIVLSFFFMGCESKSNLSYPLCVDIQFTSYKDKGLYPDTIEVLWINSSKLARINLVEVFVSVDTLLENIKPVTLLVLSDTLEYGKFNEEKKLRLGVDKLLTDIYSNREISVFATVRAATDIGHTSALQSSPTVRVR